VNASNQTGIGALARPASRRERAPADWHEKRLRFALSLNPSWREAAHLKDEDEVSFVPMEAVGEFGGLDLSATKPFGDVGPGYTFFADGDVVVAKITPCFENGKGALARNLRNSVAFGTTELHVLRATPTNLLPEYLFYLSISQPFRAFGESSMYGAGGQKRVSEDFVKNFRWPLPPLSEQRAIAAFLNRETARIDALIEKKRRLIELLQERRAAVITRAVTRGLTPDCATVETGVPWLGSIPAHWQFGLLKRFCRVTDCKHFTVSFVDEGFPVASVGELSGNRLDLANAKLTTEREFFFLRAGRVPKRGDLVYCRNASVGLVGFVDTDTPFALGQDVCLISSPLPSNRFLYYLLQSRLAVEQLSAVMVGATFKRINVEKIKEFWVVWPSEDEQTHIAEFLDNATGRIDMLISRVRAAVDQMLEYRAALISAAVTGQIDVREAA